MKHQYYVFSLLLCFFQAHMVQSQSEFAPCGDNYWREKALQDPIFYQKNQAFEEQILQMFKLGTNIQTIADAPVTIPVVVHIIHNGGPENLSDLEVQQGITWLNQAFANQGSFNQGSGADCGIQLCLAQRTPEGQATDGITRNLNQLTEMIMENDDSAVKGLNRWKPTDYVNIWLVRSICSDNYGCGVYGYSNYPYAHGSNIDGIVIEADYLTSLTRIGGLAHEMGHFLGLYHTFEGSCFNNNCLTNGDRICDTPPDQSTAGVPCGQTVNTCTTDTQSGPFSTDQPDMSWNYMDYGILACFHDFTADQATRMNATLEGVRKSLLESKGCLPPCPAITLAGFIPSALNVEAGETVTFNNTSQNASSYSWTINGAPFSTQFSPNFTFNSAGVYTIELSVQPTNSTLCTEATAKVVIEVFCSVSADFTASDLTPEEEVTILLHNTSQNASQFDWQINGLSQGNVLDSINFSTPGVYEITLIAGNGICADTTTTTVYVQGICLNKTFEYDFLVQGFTVSNKAAQLTDGNWIVSALISNFAFDETPFYVKLKPDGKVLWVKQIGTDTSSTNTLAMAATPDGGFIALWDEIRALTPQIQNHFLAKYSANGQQIWAQKINRDLLGPNALAMDVLVHPDGSFTINGGYLAKFDAAGNNIWMKQHSNLTQLSPHPDGGYLALNNQKVVRLDPLGNILWSREYTTNPAFKPLALIAKPDGSIFVTGEHQTSNLNIQHGALLKLDSTGQVLWAKKYREIPNSTYLFQQITHALSGNIILAGLAVVAGSTTLTNCIFIAEVDLDGKVVWIRHRPKTAGVTDLVPAIGGGYMLTGGQGLWILKANEGGKTTGCTEKTASINVFDLPITSSLDPASTIPAEVWVPTPAMPPIVDLLWIVNTLCKPECLQTFEVCNNNLDDDEDGLFDCLDSDCNCSEDKCFPKQANIWYFGNKAGLDFNTNPPTELTDGQTNAFGFSATISDANGNLMFYCDGERVFNRFHQVMANGQIIGSQQTIIVPHPGKVGQYYILTNLLGETIHYTLVDLSLDEGRGDVVITQKDKLLADPASGIAAVKACGADGYWILTRQIQGGDKFYAFQINQTGLVTNPVISSTGQNGVFVRQLKFSSSGNQVACSYLSNNFVDNYVAVYEFNANTGSVFNQKILQLNNTASELYGVEFSPSGQFLYVMKNGGNAQILQYDLEAGDLMSINNSETILTSKPLNTSFGYPQLGPNGKIYFSYNQNNPGQVSQIDVIHQPDLPGLACQYQASNLNINPPANASFGLCNIIASSLTQPHLNFHPDAQDTICSPNTTVAYMLPKLPCEIDSITWRTENLSAVITPNFQSAEVLYLSPGSGQLIATMYTPCGPASDTLQILVVEPLNKTLDLGPDLVVCQNGVFEFKAGSGFAKYQWSNGTTDSTTTTLFPGVYWVNVWDLCGNLQSDTITVSIGSNTILDLGPDLLDQCSDFTASFQRPSYFDTWQWSPNNFLNCTDCPNVSLAPTASTRWVVVAKTDEGCVSVDTLNITIRDTLFFKRDTSVCIGQTLALFGVQLPADTTAEFFMPTPGLGCDTILTVNVFGVENSSSALSTTICPNAFYSYQGVLLPPDTVAIFHLSSAQGCDSVVTVTTTAFPPLIISLPMDTTIHLGASILLEAELDGVGALDFVWSPNEALSCINCLDPVANPWDTITYTLSATDANGCVTEETVTIRVNEECRVRVPTAFTPNADGANDRFRPVLDPCVYTVRIWRILNRWGQTVFEQYNFPATDPNLGWDGDWNGKPHPSDVLIWVAEYEYYDGRREIKNGQITLIR